MQEIDTQSTFFHFFSHFLPFLDLKYILYQPSAPLITFLLTIEFKYPKINPGPKVWVLVLLLFKIYLLSLEKELESAVCDTIHYLSIPLYTNS